MHANVTNLSHSYFIKVLIIESKKVHPNLLVVNELMSSTFALRRGDILSKSCDIQTIFSKYPFLQNSEQVKLYKVICFMGQLPNIQPHFQNCH